MIFDILDPFASIHEVSPSLFPLARERHGALLLATLDASPTLRTMTRAPTVADMLHEPTIEEAAAILSYHLAQRDEAVRKGDREPL